MRFPVLSLQRALVGMVLAGAVAGSACAAPALPTAAQFFQDYQLASATLSPDAHKLAFLQRLQGGNARLVVLDLQTFKPAVVASYKDPDVAHFRWVNDHRLVFSLDTTLTGPGRVDHAAGLYAVDADGSKYRQLVASTESWLKDGNDYAAEAMLPWNTWLSGIVGEQTGNDVVVETPEQLSMKKADYYRLRSLNTLNGATTEIDTPLHSYRWIADQHGQPRAAVSGDGKTTAILYRGDDGQWSKLDEFDSFVGAGLQPLFLDTAGRLYVRADYKGHLALFTYDTQAHRLAAQPVLASPEFDLSPRPVFGSGKLLGIRYTIDAEVTNWFDPGMKAIQQQVDALLPNTANRISVAARPATSFVLVEAFSDVHPNTWYLFDTQKRKLMKVGGILPPLDPAQLGRMDFVHYKARDGMTIPAYLTMPPGAQKKNLPLVVLVHGGPWVRGGEWEWNPEVQFLASRGYAVLQPEYRGSTGFGSAHFRAGWKQWGLAMQDDVADGARWAISQGIADPARICIAGASYGGYATLMGLARDGQLYRCGVNWVGVTDINLMYDVGWSDFSDEYKRWGMPSLVGDQKADAAQLKAASPLEQASRITQPLILAYGAYDVRVPIVHGEKFRDAVKGHNSQVEWIEYPKEGHGWFLEKDRIDFWTRVEKFLAHQIGGAAAP